MCARGAPYDHFGRALAFYSPDVGLLDADWLQRVNCGALIGWSLQPVTSLRHAVAAKVLLLGKRFLRLPTGTFTHHKTIKKDFAKFEVSSVSRF